MLLHVTAKNIIMVVGCPTRWACNVRTPCHCSPEQVYQLTPMDLTTLSHTQSIIALYTELDAKCDQQMTIFSLC